MKNERFNERAIYFLRFVKPELTISRISSLPGKSQEVIWLPITTVSQLAARLTTSTLKQALKHGFYLCHPCVKKIQATH